MPAAVTEIAGVLCLIVGATIGWFVLAAPVAALGVTTLFMRPTVEITRDGVLQRQYLYSSLTRWDAIDHVGVTHVGNLTILAYRLRPGIPPPRRQPAAVMLRAADAPYDGGWFADSLVGKPDEVLGVVMGYLANPALRDELPITRRSRSLVSAPVLIAEESAMSRFVRSDVASAIDIQPGAVVSRVIFSDDRIEVTVFGFDAGAGLSEHQASRAAIVQVAKGRLEFIADGEQLDAGPGFWLHMEPGTPHSLTAREPTVMLLTLVEAG